jgi:hypothetical protein
MELFGHILLCVVAFLGLIIFARGYILEDRGRKRLRQSLNEIRDQRDLEVEARYDRYTEWLDRQHRPTDAAQKAVDELKRTIQQLPTTERPKRPKTKDLLCVRD